MAVAGLLALQSCGGAARRETGGAAAEVARAAGPPPAAGPPLAAGPPRPQAGGTLFVLRAPRAATVAVAGSFNGWLPTANPCARRDSLWHALVPLERGRHLYKYVVDGTRWIVDPANPQRAGDGSGGLASVVVVP
jgi:hypothetical protein